MKIKVLGARQMYTVLIYLLLAVLLVGCGAGSKAPQGSAAGEDIITQKKITKGKTPITVLVKYAFPINVFEKIVEEKFPDIDIIQVGNYTGDRGLVEYERRLQHDDLTDIVMTWPLEIGSKYWQDRLIDLSSMPFTSNYHTSMLNKISTGGSLYYLPGPAQIRGIVYNKTLFAENNWQVPNNFAEFVALCQKIEASGIRSLQLGFGNPEVLDTAFVGFSYGNSFSKPQDSQWLSRYNQGQGSFAEQYGPAIDTFQTLINAGILKKEDLQIHYPDREWMIFNRKCAMVEDSLLMARMGYRYNGSTDEFALMPFFNQEFGRDWARLYMVCYIGANKHLLEPQNKEKYQLVMKLLEYISTPEGQQALAADTGAMYSSVNNVPLPDTVEIQALRPALSEGRAAIFPELKNAQGALRQGLAQMLNGQVSKTELVALVDQQNQNPVNNQNGKVLGQAAEHFTIIETGNFVTDVMRQKAATDFALFLDNGKDGRFNGKGISARLYKGPQKEADIVRVLPDLKYGEAGVLQKIEMSGAALINTLEYSLPVNNNISGWFYYFSGLKIEFDPTAIPGSRIHKITDAAGRNIEPNTIYSVAVMDMTVQEQYIKSKTDTGLTIKAILIEAVQKAGTITPANDGRFIIVKS